MNFARISFTLTLAVALCCPIAFAQAAPATDKPAPDATAAKPAPESPCARPNTELCPERTIYLNNVSQQSEANEIVTALRNTLPPNDKIYLVASQNAIVVRATPEDIALAQKLLTDLDRPKKNYRLTYTVSEKDGAKLVRTQRYTMVVSSGQTTTLKQGSKIPVVTGSYSAVPSDKTPAGAQTQFTYLDVGMNFNATLDAMGNNAMLKSSVEQSSVAPEKSDIAGVQEPIVRQSSLKGVALLAPGKPQMLGSMDIPGSTTRLDIEVLMEPLP
jgi:type II secretory pathway component GspD/PulD (secretin)